MLLALLLLSLFTLVLLGFYVFVAAPRSRGHQTFAAFIACLALWTVNDILMWGFGRDELRAGAAAPARLRRLRVGVSGERGSAGRARGRAVRARARPRPGGARRDDVERD
jgi:hypothetical protein